MSSNGSSRDVQDHQKPDHSNRPLVVYGGLAIAMVSAIAAVLAVWPGGGEPDTGAQPTTSTTGNNDSPTSVTTLAAPTEPASPGEPKPALAKGRWSTTKNEFTLTVTEVGVTGSEPYVRVVARNARAETVTLAVSCFQFKDAGGRTHETDPFADGTDWPEQVPPGDQVVGILLFEKPLLAGRGTMRLDCDRVFVPSPDATELWNGVSVTGIEAS